MFCTKCGTKVDDNAKFCKGCGTAVNKSSSDTKEEAKDNSTTKIEPAESELPPAAKTSVPSETNQMSQPNNNEFSSSTKGTTTEQTCQLLKQATSTSARIEDIRYDSKGVTLKGKYNKYIVNIINGNVTVRIYTRIWLALLWGFIWITALFTTSSQKEERDAILKIICDTLGANPEEINKAERKRAAAFLLMFFGILFAIPGLLILILSYLLIEGTTMAIGFTITIVSAFMIIMGIKSRNNYKVKYENSADPSPQQRKTRLIILSASGVLSVVFIIFSALWINGVFDSYNNYNDTYSDYNSPSDVEDIYLGRTYTNNDEGFTFNYPSDWNLFDPSELDEYIITGLYAPTELGYSANIQVTYMIGYDENLFTVSESEIYKILLPYFDEIDIINISYDTFIKIPSIKITYNVKTIDGLLLTIIQYYYAIENVTYSIDCHSHQYTFDKYEPIFNAIIDSYTITRMGNEVESENNSEELFKQIIDAYATLEESGYPLFDESIIGHSLLTVQKDGTYNFGWDSLPSLTYSFYDINADGSSELLIGVDDGYYISGIYTLQNGKPVSVIQVEDRHVLYLRKDSSGNCIIEHSWGHMG